MQAWWSPRRRRVAALVLLIAALALPACASDDGTTIDVFAAASLTNAFGEIVDEYEIEHPEHQVRLNLAGSSTLREQLRDGAQADVFVSANAAIMSALVADGTITGTPQVLATNTLVLAVPAGNPAAVTSLDDLERSSLFVGICAAGVPCGDLASELLTAAKVEASIDTEEPDAAALVRRLVDAELDVGLVYASDVSASGGALQAITIDGEPPASAYPMAAVNDSDDSLGTAEFIAFVRSERGAAILRRWGFETP